jgi:hypothetical protein
MSRVFCFLFQRRTLPKYVVIVMTSFVAFATPAFATKKGLTQIVTPDLQAEGDLSLSLQIQDKRIANPYELQAELGLTKWAEVAVFKGFKPDDYILATKPEWRPNDQ